jgi:hypothetical protein
MFSNNSIYILMFTTGFFGGFGHCIGMCGTVVALLSMKMKRQSVVSHLFFHFGRLTTYTLLGGLMGFTGSYVGMTGSFLEIQRALLIVAGAVILLMGLSMAGWLPLTTYLEKTFNLFPLIMKITKAFSNNLTGGALYALGIILGFMPCGLVYTALIAAARLGMESTHQIHGLFAGMALLLCFAIGTLWALLLFGKVVAMLSASTRFKLYRIASILTIITAIVFIKRGLNF